MKQHAFSRCLIGAGVFWLVAITAAQSHAGGLLYFVNTTSDTVVVGACENANPGCSLRGAIGAANNHPGVDGIDINLSGGAVINLTAALPDITEGVGITGPGAARVTVQRNSGGVYRIFNVTTTGTVGFSGITITGGSAPGSDHGGGIANSNTGTVNVLNCRLNGNNSTGGSGGGIANLVAPGTVNVTNCLLNGNSAFGGGGIFNAGTVNVTNSTLSGNSASGVAAGGGGIFNNGGTLNVTNSTLSGNSSTNGHGILTNSTMNIKSSIIALNPSGPDVRVIGIGSLSHGFNLIGKNDGAEATFPPGNPNANNDIVGTSALPIDPKLDPQGLVLNGGQTHTIALLSDSPAIDKGTSNGLTGNLTTDQRGAGFPRTFNQPSITDATGGDGTDIGAFELLAPFSVSRKMHGATPFDIPNPLVPPVAIECRSGGATRDFQVITTFPSSVTVNGNPQAQVTSGTGTVGANGVSNGGVVTVSDNVVTVPLTSIANAQTIVITLFAVNDGTGPHNVTIQLSFLLGDTSGNGSVNASDVSQTKSKSGQTLDNSNFRTDVTVSNSINSSDVSLVKSKSGTALP